ncbi:MAG: DUF4382 domain-containing protein [Candidatus Marinimicrobia bacterium]|nr:DUF4382 domain-containing protein [Candidatus Neomarinimicrobiota bacterium]
MKITGKIVTLGLLALLIAGLGACDSISSDDVGTLSVSLTDAPFPTDLVAEANVTVTKLEVREAGGTGGSPFIILTETVQSYNLLDLRNGVTAALASLDVPVGSYDLLRIYISEGSVVMKAGPTYNLTVPSGAQTGLKLFISPAIDVTGGLTSDLILDLDVEQSFISQGQGDGITGFLFKPVIRVANASTVGSLAGSTTDTSAIAIADARIWVAQDSVVANSYSDANGNYAILGLPSGTYTASASATGYDTVVVSIDIGAGSQTTASFELTAQ